jgi:hypothetical protein
MRKKRTPPTKRLLVTAKAILSKTDSIYKGNLKYWIEMKHHGQIIPNRKFERVLEELLDEDKNYVIENDTVWKKNSEVYKKHLEWES